MTSPSFATLFRVISGGAKVTKIVWADQIVGREGWKFFHCLNAKLVPATYTSLGFPTNCFPCYFLAPEREACQLVWQFLDATAGFPKERVNWAQTFDQKL